MRSITFAPLLALALLLGGASAYAQTGTTTDVTTPGAPNTGVGGSPEANALTLAASAAVFAGGALYLMRGRTS